ncbi:MAG: type II toxin-antitoxin system mRNA interferase toxin, RelE/StbE family [Chloroflexi bacterium]|nr:type II toxin-antitoxin system mRNA interferase toxin, RelE/StbE family [Chloroflexota bacterium]
MTERPGRGRVRIKYTPHFTRRVQRLPVDEKRALARALRIFQQNPADPRLRTHKLHGQHEGRWAFSFGYDARVVFLWDADTAVLLDVGSHDEVYG